MAAVVLEKMEEVVMVEEPIKMEKMVEAEDLELVELEVHQEEE